LAQLGKSVLQKQAERALKEPIILNGATESERWVGAKAKA